MPESRSQQRIKEARRRLHRFLTAYTDGLSRKGVRRLFDQDASEVFTVLGSGAPSTKEDGLGPALGKLRALLLGLAFKLSPPRRLLFTAALLLPLVGLIDFRAQLGPTVVALDFSPFWFSLSVICLVFLLALELVDRVRVRDEIEVARELQQELLPAQSPLLRGYQVAHSYRTANDIGGDYFDFVPLSDGRLALAVGDASGHGMGAGLLMAIAQATLHTAIDLDPEPAKVLDLLNRALVRSGGKRAFMTLFYGVLDPASGKLRYACAGHPFPLHRSSSSGKVAELGTGNLPLGLRQGVQYPVAEAVLQRGDALVLYSDGLPEAVSAAQGDAFGFEQVRRLAAQPAAPMLVHDQILAAFDRHLGDEPLSDDLTLVVIGRDQA